MFSTLSPLISIIIPAYNAERFIDETLKSIQAQSYMNWEAIVVDDHSSDRTADVVKAIASKDARIRYHLAPCHGGRPSINRNIGISLAQGEYITFMDSDDVYYPNGLEILLEPLLKDVNLNASMAFPYYCDNELMPLHPSPHLVERANGSFEFAPDYQLSWEAICRREISFFVCCLMARKSTIETMAPLDETLLTGDDFKLVVSLLCDGVEKIKLIPTCTYKYRNYAGSITKKPERLLSTIVSHVSITNWLFNLSELPENLKFLKGYHLSHRLAIIASTLTKMNEKKLAKKVILESFKYRCISKAQWVNFFGKELVRLSLPTYLQDFCSWLFRTNKVNYFRRSP